MINCSIVHSDSHRSKECISFTKMCVVIFLFLSICLPEISVFIAFLELFISISKILSIFSFYANNIVLAEHKCTTISHEIHDIRANCIGIYIYIQLKKRICNMVRSG